MMIVMMTMMKIHGLGRGVANTPLLSQILFLLQSLSMKRSEADEDDNLGDAEKDGNVTEGKCADETLSK